jgi:hypothetical protein
MTHTSLIHTWLFIHKNIEKYIYKLCNRRNEFYSLRKREVKLKCTRKGVLYEMKWMEELNNLWVNRSKRKCKLLLHERDSYKLISTLR